MSKKMLFSDFVEKANQRYDNKFEYVEETFNGSHDKMKIICPEHGEFWQAPRVHLKYLCGCPTCSYVYRAKNYTTTTEEFINKARFIHGNKYDYSKVEYKDVKTPVTIICSIHGEYQQVPNNHLNGEGCPKCNISHLEILVKGFLDDFDYKYIWQYKNQSILGNQSIDFYLEDYNIGIECQGKQHFVDGCWNSNNLDTIIINDIKKKKKCDTKNIKILYVFPDFIKKMNNEIYNDENIYYISELKDFLYNLQYATFYKNNVNELFSYIEQVSGEKCILNNSIIRTGDSNKTFYLISLKNDIECGGAQISRLNGNEDIIQIFEDEWINKKNICKSRIRVILGKNNEKIFARNTTVKQITNKECKTFCRYNHLQGEINSKINYGLFYNNQLVSVMCFGKKRKNLGSKSIDGEYELLRFCNKLNTNVVGGASKLLKQFIKEYNPKVIISYCDRRWSNGNMYETIGFIKDHYSKPSYFYIVNNNRENRFNYRKDILIKKYNCPPDISEHEFCKMKGWNRIYDCGTIVYKMKMG